MTVAHLVSRAVLAGVALLAAGGATGQGFPAKIGFLAPARTPEAVVSRLNQEIARVLHRPDVRERFISSGAEPVGSTPEQFGAAMKSEMAKWGKLIREAGLRED